MVSTAQPTADPRRGGQPDRVDAARRLLPRLWGGEHIEDEARALLAAAIDVRDAPGECAALYALTAASATGADHGRTAESAYRLVGRAADTGQRVWESLGRQYVSRVHLRDAHEALALEELASAEVLLDDAAPTIVLASALNGLAAIYSSLSLYADCERLYGRATEILTTVRDAWAGQVLVYNRLLNHATWTLALQRAGYSDEARSHAAESAARLRSSGDAVTEPTLACGVEVLLLFCDVMAGRRDPGSGARRLSALVADRHVEAESYARFALAVGWASCGDHAAARREVARGLELSTALDDDSVQLALRWQYGRIASLEHHDHPGVRDAWAYAELATGQVWESRLRRRESARDRVDIHRLPREHEVVERRSLEDPLTGAANRRRLDPARDALSTQPGDGSTAVLFLDVDEFKTANDTYGHAVGDEVLRRVVSLLQAQVRAVDLVGRYRGDELVIVAPGCSTRDAAGLAERLLETVREHPWHQLAPELAIRLSIGVAVTDVQHHRLFAAADEQLYAAKRAGRDRVSMTVI